MGGELSKKKGCVEYGCQALRLRPCLCPATHTWKPATQPNHRGFHLAWLTKKREDASLLCTTTPFGRSSLPPFDSFI